MAATAYNLAYLRDSVKRKLQGDELFSDDEVDLHLNEGLDQLALYMATMRTPWQITTDIGVREYNLPSDILGISKAEYDGKELTKMTVDEGIRGGVDTTDTQQRRTTPGRYYIRMDTDNWFIGLDSPPDASKTLTIYYVQKQPDLVDDTDIPNLPRPFIRAAIHWACAELLENDATEEGRSMNERSTYHWNKFMYYSGQVSTIVGNFDKRKILRNRRR